MTNSPSNSYLAHYYGPFMLGICLPILWPITILVFGLKHKCLKWYDLIPLYECIILIYFNNCILYGILYWWLIHFTHWTVFSIPSAGEHRSEQCWTEGDINGSKDFVEHQLLTSQDFWTKYGLIPSIFLFSSLNDHRTHHLFPTIDHSKFYKIRPIIINYCKKNNDLKKYVEKQYTLIQLINGTQRRAVRIKAKKE